MFDNSTDNREIVYVDMDGVLVDFQSGIQSLGEGLKEVYRDRWDECPGIFSKMEPMPGAIDGFAKLSEKYDTYILSTAPWNNPSAWTDKYEWVQGNLMPHAYKRLILSHNKHLNAGDYLIDDRLANGAGRFRGEFIQFGSAKFPDWDSILNYML